MKENQDQPQPIRSRIKSYNELNLYGLSKQALIKKLQTLVHELKIYHRMDEDGFKTSKDIAEMDITIESYKHNQEVLMRKVTLLQKEQNKMKNIIQEKDKIVQSLTKEVNLYKKKIEEVEKKVRKQKIDRQQVNHSKVLEDVKNENLKIKKKMQEYFNKCQILETLNKQTEQKLAQQLLKKQSNETECISMIEKKSGKENDCHMGKNNCQQKQQKIELFSLKEQIRELREQLRNSEQAKTDLKTKLQEREIFYAKMIKINQ